MDGQQLSTRFKVWAVIATTSALYFIPLLLASLLAGCGVTQWQRDQDARAAWDPNWVHPIFVNSTLHDLLEGVDALDGDVAAAHPGVPLTPKPSVAQP